MESPSESLLRRQNQNEECSDCPGEEDKSSFLRKILATFCSNKNPEREPLLPVGERPRPNAPEVCNYIRFLDFIWEYVLTERSRDFFKRYKWLFFVLMTLLSILSMILTQMFYGWSSRGDT